MSRAEFEIYKNPGKGYPWRVWYRGGYLPFSRKRDAKEFVKAEKALIKRHNDFINDLTKKEHTPCQPNQPRK